MHQVITWHSVLSPAMASHKLSKQLNKALLCCFRFSHCQNFCTALWQNTPNTKPRHGPPYMLRRPCVHIRTPRCSSPVVSRLMADTSPCNGSSRRLMHWPPESCPRVDDPTAHTTHPSAARQQLKSCSATLYELFLLVGLCI